MKDYLRSLATRDAGTRMVRLGLIGVLNTIAYFVAFNVLRSVVGVSLFWSITIAFATATLGSYVLNRRWTFDLVHNSGGLEETVRFFGINAIAWGITVAMVTGADRWFGPLGTIGENMVSLLAAGIIIVPKFASYRDLVFHKALRHQSDMRGVVTADPD
ncbi:MAG: GtrA family protein [Acidimicrobiia bacterium]|nr:GtrA family protein [Acidimicrobiia bacterium]